MKILMISLKELLTCVLFCVSMIYNVNAQNAYPTTQGSYIKIDGGGINQLAPKTNGGWARGISYYNSDMTQRFFGMGIFGSVDKPARFYFTFAEGEPWSSQLGIHILPNGNIGIGTIAPVARLSVNGGILAKEIKIKTDITVPDYVFNENYELMSLSQIEDFINKHKHLPEIPSAKEIGNDGMDLAEMNLLLLKKVEELTLHLIQKENEVSELSANLKNLASRVTELESK